MGIYRYQGQQNGNLRDCSTQTKPAPQPSQDQPSESEWSVHSSQSAQSRSVQDWQVQDQPVQSPPTHQSKTKPVQSRSPNPRSGQRWLKQGQWIGLAVKNLSTIVTGSVVLVSTVALVSAWRSGSDLLDNIVARFSQPQPEPTITMQPVLVQQLRNASELTTAVFAMQTVVPTSRDRTLGGYTIGRTTLLYIAYGEVRAGVDLSALTPEDVRSNGDTIDIRLPPPQILDSKIDVTRSKIYDYDRGFLGLGPDAAPQLQEFAEQETLGQIVATACTQGILQSANERAKLTVSQLLTTAGYATSNVETQAPTAETCAMANPDIESTEPLPSGSPQSDALPPEPTENLSPPPAPLQASPPVSTQAQG